MAGNGQLAGSAGSIAPAGPASARADDRACAADDGGWPAGFSAFVAYREPYRFGQLLAFFRMRALEGVEVVDDSSYARTVRLPRLGAAPVIGWIRVTDDPQRQALCITMSESLREHASELCARVGRQFDVGGDPQAVLEAIASLEGVIPGSVVPGTRVPGCFDSFETACRAVLGQQVTVVAANRLAARIVAAHGAPADTGVPGLTRAFPTPSDILALGDPEAELGVLGVIRTRTRVIVELARLLEAGDLELEPTADTKQQIERLLAIKGVGPWTANYLAMRTLSHPDAFMETDAGVAHALPGLSPRERRALAEQWRPWRSYATVSLWNSLAT